MGFAPEGLRAEESQSSLRYQRKFCSLSRRISVSKYISLVSKSFSTVTCGEKILSPSVISAVFHESPYMPAHIMPCQNVMIGMSTPKIGGRIYFFMEKYYCYMCGSILHFLKSAMFYMVFFEQKQTWYCLFWIYRLLFRELHVFCLENCFAIFS